MLLGHGVWPRVLLEMMALEGGGSAEDSSAYRPCKRDSGDKGPSVPRRGAFLKAGTVLSIVSVQSIFWDTDEVSSVPGPAVVPTLKFFHF